MSVFGLGIELNGEGSHPAAWRRANHPPSESLAGPTLTRRVRAGENAGLPSRADQMPGLSLKGITQAAINSTLQLGA
jgi:hypothetical protein